MASLLGLATSRRVDIDVEPTYSNSDQVECVKENDICQTNKANRDLNSATNFKTQINLKPIYLFDSNLKLSDFKLPKNPREFLENIAKDLGFKNSQIQEIQDIEYEKPELTEEEAKSLSVAGVRGEASMNLPEKRG